MKQKRKITFLGTGTSQGIPVIGCTCPVCSSSDSRDKRKRVSALVSIDNTHILIDCGPDFRQQCLAYNFHNIEAILLTHEHRDHTAGLDDIRPICFKYEKNIPLYSKERTINNIKKDFRYIFEESEYEGLPRIDTHIVDADFYINDIPITPIQVLHHKLPILGFRIYDLAYITDCKTINNNELYKLKGLKILVLNALQINKHISHLTLQEAIDLIHVIKPEKAFLTHFSHHFGIHEKVSKTLPDNIHLAYDGLELDF